MKMTAQHESAAGDPQPVAAVETARMLNLCAAQVKGALGECDAAVERLLEVFTTVAGDAQWFWRAAMSETSTAPDPQMIAEMNARSARLVARANAAIQALQFHDRLTQRLGHVSHSLNALTTLVTDEDRSQRPEDWQELQDRLGRLYRTQEEIDIFEAATGTRHGTRSQPPAPGAGASRDIELF